MLSRKRHKLGIIVLYQSNPTLRYVTNRLLDPLLRLAKRQHEVHVISTSIISPAISLKCHKVKALPFGFTSALFLVQSLLTSLRIARNGNFHIFLGYRQIDFLVGCLVKKITGCRLVYYAHGDSVTIHQLASQSIMNKFKVCLLKIIEKVVLPKVNLIISVSQDTKSRLLNRLRIPSNKIVVVYNNILPANSCSTQLLRRLKGEGKRLIGFLGQFDHLKGVETLLQAFSLLTRSINNPVLVLVGDGPIRKHLEELTTQMNLLDKVIFTGWVPNPLDYMRDFDVLVVPSLHEGCPSVVLEAFSLNIPVLGSRAGGIPELLGYDELLFQPNNPKELASKLEMILASDEMLAHTKDLIMDRKHEFIFDHTSRIEELLSRYL